MAEPAEPEFEKECLVDGPDEWILVAVGNPPLEGCSHLVRQRVDGPVWVDAVDVFELELPFVSRLWTVLE